MNINNTWTIKNLEEKAIFLINTIMKSIDNSDKIYCNKDWAKIIKDGLQ